MIGMLIMKLGESGKDYHNCIIDVDEAIELFSYYSVVVNNTSINATLENLNRTALMPIINDVEGVINNICNGPWLCII